MDLMEMNTSLNARNLRTAIADLKIDVQVLIVILKNRTQSINLFHHSW